jgi:hypothetical protein
MLHSQSIALGEVGLMSVSRTWSRVDAVVARTLLGAALLVAGACGGGDEQGGAAAGAADSGAVAALDYEVTPERYQRWVAAQRALDAIPGMPAPPRIDPLRLDDAELRRAVEYLEGDPRARAALARAGISARDYVLTTVALDQALVSATAPPGAAPTAGAPTPSATRPAAPSTSSRSAATATPTGAPPQPQLVGTPARNVELVRRNRDDVVHVLRTMRFRISEPLADAVDTTIRRSDSVSVGKDLTVKWDVTIRRNRDTSKTRRPTPTDTAPRDSTRPPPESYR